MKSLSVILMFFLILHSGISYAYDGSTTAAVVLAGGIIKAQHTENTTKYKRKNCPICKGKGWYLSGDSITKVPCGYCEPETQGSISEIMHPPFIIKAPHPPSPVCNGPQCQKPISVIKR